MPPLAVRSGVLEREGSSFSKRRKKERGKRKEAARYRRESRSLTHSLTRASNKDLEIELDPIRAASVEEILSKGVLDHYKYQILNIITQVAHCIQFVPVKDSEFCEANLDNFLQGTTCVPNSCTGIILCWSYTESHQAPSCDHFYGL